MDVLLLGKLWVTEFWVGSGTLDAPATTSADAEEYGIILRDRKGA